MIQTLPDELISLIISCIIRPWHLKMSVRRSPTSMRNAFRGLPDVANFKLVNKRFYDEIRSHTLQRFTGRFDARVGRQGEQQKVLYRISEVPQWVWDRVTLLQMKYCAGWRCKKLLTNVSMPQLQRVFLEGEWIDPAVHGSSDQAMAGLLDGEIVNSLRDSRSSYPATWLFWFGKMADGGQSRLLTEWKIACGVKFLVEIQSPTSLVVLDKRVGDFRQELLRSIRMNSG